MKKWAIIKDDLPIQIFVKVWSDFWTACCVLFQVYITVLQCCHMNKKTLVPMYTTRSRLIMLYSSVRCKLKCQKTKNFSNFSVPHITNWPTNKSLTWNCIITIYSINNCLFGCMITDSENLENLETLGNFYKLFR